ncbi:protein-S-isoprenylcysteine O-methyltransferase [Calothrix rhizosoleniae]|uniref:protein-S-isoprenylcysteine O-methyltransferase n=1 Tax=Calothrix rhizosoleniae TaxID=888997 RepID=UPI000B49A6AF|nr:protein-S-isoprenylcysteine O-methyltransferase [Calothrix rhizosoleniae]
MEQAFVVVYFVGVCIAGAIRVAQSRKHLRAEKTQIPALEIGLMLLWFFASQFLPLLYGVTPVLTFADYPFPSAISILGIGIFGFSLWLLRRSHLDLDHNWSPAVEILPEQVLITQGVYRYVRHPMYSAHLLWGVAQGLLIHNWLVGWFGLITFALFCWYRIPKEETLMQTSFGSDYAHYKQMVGAIAPRVGGID